jgi:riboflavin synthase
MFTGIVEETGSVLALEPRSAGARLRLRCAKVLEGLKEGDSVSVNGVCLTAVGLAPNGFSADLAPETISRSNLGDLTPNALVNLERSMPASGRFDGHIVQGHVDGVGTLTELRELGDGNWWLTIAFPPELARYIVHKGSIAIEGISLTVAALTAGDASVTIIPHTFEKTALRNWTAGRRVNLEVDVIAKYVERMLGERSLTSPLTLERLKENGY